MIYKAVEVIWIFSADGRAGRDGTGGTGIEGTIRGPRGPKKASGPLEGQVSQLLHVVNLNLRY